jgi:UDP-2,3-diacylglucosamine hydrolase
MLSDYIIMPSMEQANRAGLKVFFVSDAHLTMKDSPSESESRLMLLFDIVRRTGSHLYIVGDLFDFWFEYKYAIPSAYLKVISGLLELTRSEVEVSYIPGNHDFWMRDYLQRQAGVRLTGDYYEARHFGRRIFITHGDGIDSNDRGYRMLKRIFRNRFCIWLYSQLPVNIAYRLAMATSHASRQLTDSRDEDYSNDYLEFGRGKIESGYNAVVMGHIHRPEITDLGSGVYVNSGDFFRHFSYVILDESGFQLKYLSDLS